MSHVFRRISISLWRESISHPEPDTVCFLREKEAWAVYLQDLAAKAALQLPYVKTQGQMDCALSSLWAELFSSQKTSACSSPAISEWGSSFHWTWKLCMGNAWTKLLYYQEYFGLSSFRIRSGQHKSGNGKTRGISLSYLAVSWASLGETSLVGCFHWQPVGNAHCCAILRVNRSQHGKV